MVRDSFMRFVRTDTFVQYWMRNIESFEIAMAAASGATTRRGTAVSKSGKWIKRFGSGKSEKASRGSGTNKSIKSRSKVLSPQNSGSRSKRSPSTSKRIPTIVAAAGPASPSPRVQKAAESVTLHVPAAPKSPSNYMVEMSVGSIPDSLPAQPSGGSDSGGGGVSESFVGSPPALPSGVHEIASSSARQSFGAFQAAPLAEEVESKRLASYGSGGSDSFPAYASPSRKTLPKFLRSSDFNQD
eukprot:TRINITY_DN13373_c0_g4_i1.p2 TRINITY_DN13373_c0_g4~~TRINITY_DN13373_c0_g4_i1.p2  ORF type:complete len:242 (+),score=64.54 TRINITY_DN13373_c0_g4_i1:1231-1956(+)